MSIKPSMDTKATMATANDTTMDTKATMATANDTTMDTKATMATANDTTIDTIDTMNTSTDTLTCEMCGKDKKHVSQLWVHYCLSHLLKELRTRYSPLTSGMTCSLCDKTLGNETSLYSHIGVKHGKVNEVLASLGYRQLPACRTRAENGLK